jgi:hypothetical protein
MLLLVSNNTLLAAKEGWYNMNGAACWPNKRKKRDAPLKPDCIPFKRQRIAVFL